MWEDILNSAVDWDRLCTSFKIYKSREKVTEYIDFTGRKLRLADTNDL